MVTPSSPLPAAVSHYSAEWLALGRERDSELRAEGFLHLAGRLERRGEAESRETAAALYRSLSQSAETPAGSRQRAERRLQALTGAGAFGTRFELLLQDFTHQATDPAMLLGMGLAGGAYQAVRLGALARLAALPGGIVSRGWGARFLASAAGWAAEAPVFSVSTRLAHASLARPLDWSAGAWARELGAAYLTLGVLKMAHSGRAFLPHSAFANLYSQSATLGGLMLVHRAEEGLGWRPARGVAESFVDSLATLAQFAVAGRLSRQLWGGAFATSQAEFELCSRDLSRPRELNSTSQAMNVAWAGAYSTARPHRPAGPAKSPLRDGLVFSMSAGRPEGDMGLIGRRFQQLIEPELSGATEDFQPRPGLRFHRPKVRGIGILTSGGDGPGENAAIEALVRGAIQVHGWKVFGILDGYRGLIEPAYRIAQLQLSDVQGPGAVAAALQLLYGKNLPLPLADLQAEMQGISRIGGTILRSSRTNPLLGDPQAERVKRTMLEHGIDALVVLGGNGSMRAAQELRKAGVPLVGIPQSIDGDVYGSAHSIGFPSAVAKGASEVHHYLTTAYACGRWFLVEVMGQRYGLLTLAVADRSRVTDAAFTEIPRPLEDLREVMESRRPRRHGLILVSEGAKFRDSGPSLIEPPRGSDEHGRLLNEPGAVARWVRRLLAERAFETQTRSESLGYLLRGADVVEADRLLAERLAFTALKLLEVGRFGKMAGTSFVKGRDRLRVHSVDLAEVARNEKKLPLEYENLVRRRLEGHSE